MAPTLFNFFIPRGGERRRLQRKIRLAPIKSDYGINRGDQVQTRMVISLRYDIPSFTYNRVNIPKPDGSTCQSLWRVQAKSLTEIWL